MEEYFKFGKLVAAHGIGGDLILHHSLGTLKKPKELEVIFIEENTGSFLPYFVENVGVKNPTDLIVKLEGVDKRESAARLFPKEVWLKAEDFRKLAGKTAPIALLGYTIVEGTATLGEVIEVIEQPHQVLCTILYNNKEALIPIHEQSLLNIDHKKKVIEVSLPDGLLDIYQ